LVDVQAHHKKSNWCPDGGSITPCKIFWRALVLERAGRFYMIIPSVGDLATSLNIGVAFLFEIQA
jgi:hypothetical protein